MAEEQKKYTLKDFIIRDVKKAEGIKESTGKPWLRFKFKTTDAQAKDREFTYFPYGGLTKPETWPYDGAKVTSMTFTITEEGKYAGDCNVKKILYNQTSSPPPAEEDPFGEKVMVDAPLPVVYPIGETITKDQSVCISYVKDLMVARLAWIDHKNIPDIKDMAEELARTGAQFWRDVINNLKRMEE